MKKPFVLVDIENRELVIIIKSIAKVIPFDKIGSEQDFIDELYRRFKSINMVNKYTEVDRKAYIQLIEDLRVQHQSPLDLLKQEKREAASRPTPERPSPQSVPSNSDHPSEDELTNSTLVRSAIEKRISVDDLNIKFNTPYDYCDLSVYDQDKVRRSTQLSFFLRKGVLVKTTFDEIEAIKRKCMSERKEIDEKRRDKQIVERKDILGDDDEGLVMSDEEMRTGMSAESTEAAPTANVNLNGAEASVVSNFFGSRTENILTDGLDGEMKNILRTMKSE